MFWSYATYFGLTIFWSDAKQMFCFLVKFLIYQPEWYHTYLSIVHIIASGHFISPCSNTYIQWMRGRIMQNLHFLSLSHFVDKGSLHVISSCTLLTNTNEWFFYVFIEFKNKLRFHYSTCKINTTQRSKYLF